MTHDEIKTAWNAQADDGNGWYSLSEYEKVEWAASIGAATERAAGRDTPLAGEADDDSPEDYRGVYRAMLAAAPEQRADHFRDAAKMTLDEAIKHAEEVAGCTGAQCGVEHAQLAAWLRELRDRQVAEMASHDHFRGVNAKGDQ